MHHAEQPYGRYGQTAQSPLYLSLSACNTLRFYNNQTQLASARQKPSGTYNSSEVIVR